MSLKIKYLGMLAEATGKNEEILEFNVISVSQLIKTLQKKYPQFITMSFKVAVNHTLVEENTELKENDEVALLPPFAGG